ncbi:MAG: response regulator [Chloroflexi bacterium]|nr:response regulator [Chloroflexota bacterium]
MKRQIMLVDDESGMLDLVGLILQRQGLSVLKVKDAYTALALLESSNPDLFVLDVMMPGMNGIELCRRIRQRPETVETPVVMLSARTDGQTRRDSLEAGATLFLSKLTVQRELAAIVRQLLGIGQEQSAGLSPSPGII